jgi:hypothetical protein
MRDLKVWLEGPDFLLDRSKWPEEFNKNVKQTDDVFQSLALEEIPYVDALICNPIPEEGIKSLIQENVLVMEQVATFTIQMGNSPIEKELPRTPHKSKLFDNLVRTLVYVSRWPNEKLTGPFKAIHEEYLKVSPFADNRYKNDWKEWRHEFNEYVINHWVTISSFGHKKWKNRKPSETPLTFSLRMNFVEKNEPPHRRSILDPKELQAAELILIKDVQRHYFSSIYVSLLEVKNGGSAELAYKRLSPKEKKLVDKHQIMMDHREVLVAVGRLIQPNNNKKLEKQQVRTGFHTDLVSIMHQYYDVRLGMPPEEKMVYNWQNHDGDEPLAKRPKVEWQDERIKKWLEESTSVTRTLILMPDRGLTAESIMRAAHNRSGHAGINYTMRCVSQKFLDN